MRRKQGMVETAVGWRDLHPDLTSGEHDTLVAMIELAWHDVQIDIDTAPTSRREEALAAKISAWEWFTKEPEDYVEEGENPPRISFRAACLHLGMREERVRWSCLNLGWRPPHKVLPQPVSTPGSAMPDKWREQFIGPDEPELHREDRVYKTKKKSKVADDEPVVPATPLPQPIEDTRPPEPQAVAVADESPQPLQQQPPPPSAPDAVSEYCADLDEDPFHHSRMGLISILESSAPVVAKDAWAAWERALEGREEDD